MATTYRKRHVATSGSGLLRSLMLVCVAFFSGYLAASYVDLGYFGRWVMSLRPETSRLVSAPQLTSHAPKPKLEFYTLLTANHGAVPPPPLPVIVNNKPGTATQPVIVAKAFTVQPGTHVNSATALLAHEIKTEVKSVTQNPQASKQGYTIQVAALRSLQDAEHMKASLLLRGFPVNVSSVASNGLTWFRVMVGPFASRAQAEETQSVLVRRERMNGMIRKMDA